MINFPDSKYTYEEMFEEASKIAAGLYAFGLQKNDPVAIWGTNTDKWIIMTWACFLAGMQMVTINPYYTAEELAYNINHVSVKLLVCPTKTDKIQFFETLTQLIPDLENRNKFDLQIPHLPSLQQILLFDNHPKNGCLGWQDITEAPESINFSTVANVSQSFHDPAMMLYTSGTTGMPKAAALSHYNIVNYCYAYNKVYTHYNSSSKLLNLLPLYHIYGFLDGLIFSNSIGCESIFGGHKFRVLESLKAIDEFEASDLIGTPTMFTDIIHHPDRSDFDISSLKKAIVGGAPTTPKLVREVQKLGISLSNGYGMTENTCGTSLTPHNTSEDITCNTVGFLMPGLECKIIDINGNDCLRDEPGELVTKGWNVFLGYVNDEIATKNSFTEDGYFKTGDMALVRKDEALRIIGRAKEIIIRGGENIQPLEVETFIETLSPIKKCYVIGVPSKRFGEEVAVYIKVKSGEFLSEDEVLNHCLDGLARFKHPKYIKFVAEFPEFSTGKIKKTELKALAMIHFPELLNELE